MPRSTPLPLAETWQPSIRRNLEVQGVYRAANESFSASPVVFEYKTKALIAAPTKEGRIHLVDAAALTGAGFPGDVAGALASWQDAGGTRWIVAPSKDSVAAWKVGEPGRRGRHATGLEVRRDAFASGADRRERGSIRGLQFALGGASCSRWRYRQRAVE